MWAQKDLQPVKRAISWLLQKIFYGGSAFQLDTRLLCISPAARRAERGFLNGHGVRPHLDEVSKDTTFRNGREAGVERSLRNQTY